MDSTHLSISGSNSAILKPKKTHNLEINEFSPETKALDSSDLTRSVSAPSMSPKSACDLNRVHEELEKLNIATDVINKLELQLDEARSAFREIQSSWSHRLELLGKKLGGCIEKSRPYYEARLKVLEAQQEAQRAALRFERANSMHGVAKQQVALTQESLNRQSGSTKSVDPACLEVLNHHVQRVNEAEVERLRSEQEHHHISRRVSDATSLANSLEQELKRNIRKSKAYFDARVEFNRVLEKQKELIGKLEIEIKQKKADYNTALRNLETISEQIHERRQTLGSRDPVPLAEPSDGLLLTGALVKQKQEDEISAPPSDPEDCRTAPSNNFGGVTETENAANYTLDNQNAYCTAAMGDTVINRASATMPPSTLTSGVLLLAQELSIYDWLEEDTRRSAFALPPPSHLQPEDYYDVRYQTVPEGVKPHPSPPPDTPSSLIVEVGEPVVNFAHNQSGYNKSVDNQSETKESVNSRNPLLDNSAPVQSKTSSAHNDLLAGTNAVCDSSDERSDASSVASFADVRPITDEYLMGVFKDGESFMADCIHVSERTE